MRMCRFLIGLLLGAVPAAAGEGGDWRDRIVFTASERLRGEFVDWFRPRSGPRGANRYDFLGSRLRAGVSVTFPHLQLVVQGQDTRFAGLPDDAVVPPAGALGPGALYFLHTHDTAQGEPFLKLGFLTFRRSGLTATGGRFEYADGLASRTGASPSASITTGCRSAKCPTAGIPGAARRRTMRSGTRASRPVDGGSSPVSSTRRSPSTLRSISRATRTTGTPSARASCGRRSRVPRRTTGTLSSC